MTVLQTALDTRADDFAVNRDAMLAKLAEVESEHSKALAGGGPKYVERHHARGKLLPRERIELLLDPDSAFLELSPLAAWGSDFQVGASVVTGIGVVEGVECLVVANDPEGDLHSRGTALPRPDPPVRGRHTHPCSGLRQLHRRRRLRAGHV